MFQKVYRFSESAKAQSKQRMRVVLGPPTGVDIPPPLWKYSITPGETKKQFSLTREINYYGRNMETTDHSTRI
jgi:hypothetical protein